MKRVLLLAALVTLMFSLIPTIVSARSGCCSGHSGVCGCGCCDGSALSAKCAPYYPECYQPIYSPKPTIVAPVYTLRPSIPAPSQKPVPIATPTPTPTIQGETIPDSTTGLIPPAVIGVALLLGIKHMMGSGKSKEGKV